MPITADTRASRPAPQLPSLAGLRSARVQLKRVARTDEHGDLARVRAMSWLLDRAYVDPLLGFFLPGVGDVVGAVVGTYTIGVALRMRVAPIVIARMLMNLVMDTALGLIPLVGDVGDIAFRAHRKNLALLTDRADSRRARPSDWLLVLGAFALFLGVMVVVVWGLVRLVGALA